jgi:hypothetical protein
MDVRLSVCRSRAARMPSISGLRGRSTAVCVCARARASAPTSLLAPPFTSDCVRARNLTPCSAAARELTGLSSSLALGGGGGGAAAENDRAVDMSGEGDRHSRKAHAHTRIYIYYTYTRRSHTCRSRGQDRGGRATAKLLRGKENLAARAQA